ncbi:hypothetical protein [Nocardioides speluncae]|nr:hypothetical protein [Nocardioides speluncae]
MLRNLLDHPEVLVGERIRATPFKTWMAAGGFDAAGWLKRFTADGRP